VTESEHPEEQRSDDFHAPESPAGEQPADEQPAAETPAAAPADEPLAAEPSAAEPPAAEPVAEQPPAAEPVAEQPPAAEPVAEEPAAAEPISETPAEPAPETSPSPAASVQPVAEPVIEIEEEEIEIVPRERPEIPGADLVPDIVSESEEFLDAEARAAAEAEAEAAAARAQEDDTEEVAQPIADAAIDLAAGARYTATGKRKTSVARVILKPGTGTYSINGKPLDVFFPRETLQRVIRQPLEAVGYESRMDVVARMHGGGVSSQAGALRHGISRALLEADPNLRGELKRRGFLTRDPRVKERKKAGLKKARKRPQFSKR
jgi:small subunit ribosomal protein S9